MKKIRLVILVLFLCALIIPFHSVVKADDDQETESSEAGPTCFSLDVIFIIDQSGSMSGSQGEVPTDPYQERKTAVDAMIDWFGENVIDTCTTARHQIGVISFGSEAKIDIPMTEIKPDTFEEYLESAKRLHEKTMATDMGKTNPMLAFQEAKKMFAESQITTGGPRKKVIVFLTDGWINYLPEGQERGIGADSAELAQYINDNFPFDSVLLKREQCLSFLNAAYAKTPDKIPADKTAECLANEPTDEGYQNSTYVYMVLMNLGSAWPLAARDAYNSVAEAHGSTVMDFYNEGKENTNAIPTYFRNVLETLTGIPSSVRDCGAIAVNPYLERATFTFYKFSPNFKVKIRYTDQDTGKTYEATDGVANGGFDIPKEGGYIPYGTNERYVINHPKPGLYYVESDKCVNGGVSVFYQEAQINPGGYTLPFKTIPQYDLEPFYDTSDPFYLTYEMRDSAGNVYKNESDPFGVNVKVEVTDPVSGKKISYPMEWDNAANQFKSTQPLQVQNPGIYKVDITGTIKIHKPGADGISETLSEVFNEDKILFSHKGLEFQVDDVTPFEISVNKPVNGKTLGQIHGSIVDGWPLPVVPLQVSAKISLRNGAPLTEPVDTILSNPDQSLKAWIEFPDGTKSEPIFLKLDQNQSATFSGEIPNIDKTVPLILKVELQNNWTSEYRPDKRVQTINFSRADLLPIYKTGFYFLLLGLLIALFLFWLICSIIISRNKVSGELIISQNGVNKYERNLSSGMKGTCIPLRYSIPKKELASNPDLDLISLNVHYLPKEKDGDGGFMPRKIQVAGVCSNHETFDFELEENGVPQIYCSDSSNEMNYKN